MLSHADGEHGTVWVRGHPIAELVARHGYEGTVALMWDGFAGPGLDRARIIDELGAGRALAFSRLDDWLPGAARRPPIEGVRMALAALPDDSTPAAIAATLPVAVAALMRARNGKAPLPPDPALATAADLLRMINGAAAEPRLVAALDSLSHDRHRQRLGHVDLRGAGHRLDPRLARRRRWSAATARSPAHCTAARPAWCSTCSTRSPPTTTSTNGSTARSPRAGG